MKKNNFQLLIACLTLLLSLQATAQTKSALEDEAYDLLNNFDFARAYDAFNKLHTRYPKEQDYHFKLGICALGYPEKKEKAIEIFKEIYEKNKSNEAQYYLARALHANYKFDEAIATLQPLIDKLAPSKKKDDKATLEDARIIMNNCVSGKTMVANRLNSDVKNIGAPINTREVEGVPIITADESMMIFTYQGKKSMGGKQNAMLEPDPDGSYLSDIYMSMRNADSTWQVPTPITALNTKANDAAIALSPDGRMLFTFLSNNENEGDIFISTWNGSEFSKPEPLNRNINSPDYWEGSCSISSDGKFLYFASERPTGGFGGKDIWVSEMVNGDWGPPVNLGPRVNTPLDDDAPFIHPDGVTLFFSSKGHNSIGGYDIMYSMKENSTWSEPVNMGIPLNTTEDDRYYVINSKGDKGYFSSDRATNDAKGGQDIYMVTPGIIGEKLIVGLFKGIVFGDNKPIEAKIDVVSSFGSEALGPYFSNKANGKYLLTFKPGAVYKIKVSAEGYDPIEEELDLEVMNSYVERTHDYYLYSKPFAAANPSEVKVDTEKRFVAPLEATVAVASNQPKDETKLPETKDPVANNNTKQPETNNPVVKTDTKQSETKDPVAKNNTKQPETNTPVVKTDTKQPETKDPVAKNNTKQPETNNPVVKTETGEPVVSIDGKQPDTKQPDIKTGGSDPVAKNNTKPGKTKKPDVKQPETREEVAAPGPCNPSMPELASIKGKSLNNPSVYGQMLELIGDLCGESLVFKVQIGAYRKPENYKYDNIANLGKVDISNFPDGITRFTQKEFTTIRAAEVHRQKLISRGQRDAWIVVYVGGTRYTLEEMIMQDFLTKAVN